jgi:hypothetical protein
VYSDILDVISYDFELADSGPVDDLTMYGPNSIMFRALAINKTASSQEIKQILPKDPTYDLKAQVQFKETTPDGLTGFIHFVRECSSVYICISRKLWIEMIQQPEKYTRIFQTNRGLHVQLPDHKGPNPLKHQSFPCIFQRVASVPHLSCVIVTTRHGFSGGAGGGVRTPPRNDLHPPRGIWHRSQMFLHPRKLYIF